MTRRVTSSFSSRFANHTLIMKFLTVVCVLVTTWISAEGMHCTDDDLRPQERKPIGCAGRRMQLNHQMKEVMCAPRETMVKLVIPQPGYTFYPNYAPVRRCSGFCPFKSCMPIRTSTKRIAVRMHGYNSSECYHVSLEEHTKCKCQCRVTESDCNIHQVYSENNCACECMHKEECDKERHMVWNEKLCKCTCDKEEQICSSGLVWVPSLCGCCKVMEMPQLKPSNFISNFTTQSEKNLTLTSDVMSSFNDTSRNKQ